jgi:hypothetical protein
MPAQRRQVPPPAPEQQQQGEPPFYEATEDLHIFNAEAGTGSAVAFRKGDQVPPDLVEPNGWGGKVAIPKQFKGLLPPAVEPQTAAASTGEGSEGSDQ